VRGGAVPGGTSCRFLAVGGFTGLQQSARGNGTAGCVWPVPAPLGRGCVPYQPQAADPIAFPRSAPARVRP